MSKLVENFKALGAEIDAIYNRGEVSDAIAAELDAKLAEFGRMKAQIEREAAFNADFNRINAMASQPTTVAGADHDMSIAEFMRAKVEHDLGAKLNIDRALTATSDLGAIQPRVVGEMMKLVEVQTPVANSFRQMGAPDGMSFVVTYMNNLHGASVQAAEGDELTSWKLANSKATVNSKTIGAYVELSVQAIEKGSLNSYQQAVVELQDGLALQIERRAATELEAAVTATQTLSLTADAEDFWKGILAANRTVRLATGFRPDTIWLAADRSEYLQGLVDTTGRPLFPVIGPVNAFGTQTLESGLTVPGGTFVVADFLTAGTIIVGASRAARWWFEPRGIKTSGEDVTNLTVDVGISAFQASHFVSSAFVSLEA